jgi:hypothetical protein
MKPNTFHCKNLLLDLSSLSFLPLSFVDLDYEDIFMKNSIKKRPIYLEASELKSTVNQEGTSKVTLSNKP